MEHSEASKPQERIQESTGISQGNSASTQETRYPGTLQLYLVCLALAFTIFLPSLDQTIVSTAIPKITDEFNSIQDSGWYGSAYMMTTAAFQLSWGKAYSIFDPKWTFLLSIFIFELGSLISAVSPSSAVLILGRAVSGAGCSGVVAGAITISAHVLPLRLRPIFNGALGIFFGLAAACGPLLGGVFTTTLTWRWCFWINIPCGAATFLYCLFFVHGIGKDANDEARSKSLIGKLKQFDWIGSPVLILALVCLLLALELAGSKYPWADARIIVLLVLSAVLFAVFVVIQRRLGDTGALPPRIIRQRSIAFSALYTFFLGASLQTILYFVPIWFQAVEGDDALESGISTLPLVIAWAVFSMGAGIFITMLGQYVPFMLFGSCLTTVGIGLITIFQPGTGHQYWIPFLFLCGAGAGAGLEQPQIAAQTVLEMDDIPLGIATIILAQELGGTTFVSVVSNILNSRLRQEIDGVPGIDASQIVSAGATGFRSLVNSTQTAIIIRIYNDALVQAFYASLAVAGLSFFAACGMEWRSVKSDKERTTNGEDQSNDRVNEVDKGSQGQNEKV